MKQNNKGITLIALVITIIILIILAGISISMLLGDNGVIERAKRASQNYTIAADEEHSLLDYLTGTLEDNDVVEEARGNGTLSGEGTESNPYLIQSIEDLVYLSNQVKGGNTYTGKYFKLEVNLDFKDRRSYLNPDSRDFGDINENGPTTTLYEELTTGKGFYPIGVSDYRFEGIFDGNNKSIRNMQGRSLFGYINNSTIKNLKMLNVNISYSQGGIIDTASGDVIIDNCKTTGELTTNGYDGGIIGKAINYDGNSTNSLKVYSTSNGINITHNSYDKGGIVSYLKMDAVFENCTNTGNITGTSEIGGILAYANDTSCKVTFINCTNIGNVASATNGGSVGGIAGYLNHASDFTNCSNIGDITGSSSIGGISGFTNGISNFTDCSNKGTITGNSTSGGIVANLRNESKLKNCFNEGNIVGNGCYIGGVVGDTYGLGGKKVYLTNCYNTGDVTGTTYVGGLVSRGFSGSISHCYNTGTINCNGGAGGIVGASGGPEVTYCYNSGDIKVSSNVSGSIGGIVSEGINNVTYCYNIGNIIIETSSSTSIGSIGGICGKSSGNIGNCYNTGNITYKASGYLYYTGGILGSTYGCNITNCYNIGKITIISTRDDSYNLGGIVGDGGTATNCYNIGKIETNSTNSLIGSIAGRPSGVTSCYYLDGTYEKAIGGSTTYEVTSVEDEDSMKSTMNTKFATIEGWKISKTGGYPELEF